MPRDIEQARNSLAVKTPFVILATGQTRQAARTVEIKISPEADSLNEHPITAAKLGISLSPILQGKYKVDVTNYDNVVSSFTILATDDAKEAYENQPVQMILFILDDDKKKGPDEEQQRKERKVVYNFPEEFVRRNEIMLEDPQQAAVAKFKLIPLSSAPTSSSGTE